MKFLHNLSLPSYTLRARLMALIGTVLLFIFISTVGGVVIFIFQIESESWRGRQLEAARNAAQTVEYYLYATEEALTWVGMFASDEINQDPTQLHKLLSQYPGMMEIIILDSSGKIIANKAQDQNLLGSLFTISQSQWFQSARSGLRYVTPVQISASNDPYIILSVPTSQGGVVAARIRMNVLDEVVSQIRFGQRGSAFVINDSGKVIAHTNSSVVLANQSIAKQPEFEQILQSPENEWGGNRTDFDQHPVVSVTTAIGQTGWIVVTELPTAEAYAASIWTLVLLPLGLFLIMLISSIFIRSALLQIFLNSLEILQKGAARLGAGELSHRLNLTSQDEIGRLARTLDSMAEKLQAQQEILQTANETLEKRVIERTAELEAERDLTAQMEARHRALLNAIPDLIFRINDAGVFIDLKASSLEELQVVPEIYLGRKLTDVVPNEIAQRAETTLRQALVSEEIQDFEFNLSEQDQLNTYEARVVKSGAHEVTAIIRDVTRRKLAESRLQASLQEKEVLIKEIHHRVKNNLQTISSMLNMQANIVTDPYTQQLLRDSQSRVRSMALIHEKLYQTDNLAQINFGEYLKSLVTSLLRAYHHQKPQIQVHYDVADMTLPIELAIPCGLIVNELVTNTLKYAFPHGERAGTLVIQFLVEPSGHILLRVADDGVGFPHYVNLEDPHTLGLQLVISLVEQLDAVMEIDRQNGSAFSIRFTLPVFDE